MRTNRLQCVKTFQVKHCKCPSTTELYQKNFKDQRPNTVMKSVICTLLVAFVSFEVEAESNAVAFSAGLSRNLQLSHTEIVVYDRIYTNVGSGYDSNTGKFRCPTSGVYVFQFHSVANQGKTIWTELWHNGYYICSMYGHTTGDYATGGNSVVLRLTKGDEVYVKAVDPTNGAITNMYGASDEVYSTFSGYMVAPVYEEFPSVVG